MGYSITIQLNKGGRDNKKGLYSIYLRVIINRHTHFFNLGKKIQRYHWQGKEHHWVKPSFQFHHEWNQLLRKKYDDVRQYVYRLEAKEHAITADVIREFLEKKNGNSSLFNDYVDDYVTRRLKGINSNTFKKHQTFQRYFNKYQAVTFSQVNEELILDFCHWLNRKQNLNGPTILKYLVSFRMIARTATKEGYFERDPFYGVRVPYSERRVTAQERLTLEEIASIQNADIPPHVTATERARNEFLFCCYGAFRLSDLSVLKWKDLKTCEHGYYMMYGRAKNKRPAIVPLWMIPHATTIIEAQRGKDDTYIFPHLQFSTKQEFETMLTLHNRSLKDLAKRAGIAKKLTNSVGRHSNAQLWAKSGFPLQYISKVLGHQYITTTLHYFELNETDIIDKASEYNF